MLPAVSRMHTHLVRVVDCDLEAPQDLALGWVLVHGQLEPVLGSTLSVECGWVVVEVHDSDGDRDHGPGSWDPRRADLCHLRGDSSSGPGAGRL